MKRAATPGQLVQRTGTVILYGSVSVFGALLFALIAFFGFVIIASGVEPRPQRSDCTPRRHQAIHEAHPQLTQATSPRTSAYSVGGNE